MQGNVEHEWVNEAEVRRASRILQQSILLARHFVGLNFTLFWTASGLFLLFNENIEQGERVMVIVLV